MVSSWREQVSSPRDPGSPSEYGFMEPKYLAEEVIIHPLLIIWRSVIGSLGIYKTSDTVCPLFLTRGKTQNNNSICVH